MRLPSGDLALQGTHRLILRHLAAPLSPTRLVHHCLRENSLWRSRSFARESQNLTHLQHESFSQGLQWRLLLHHGTLKAFGLEHLS
jgi:hypothetical protein